MSVKTSIFSRVIASVIFFNLALGPIWSHNLQIVVRGENYYTAEKTIFEHYSSDEHNGQLYGFITTIRDSVSVFVTFYFTQTNSNTKKFKRLHTLTPPTIKKTTNDKLKKMLFKPIQEVLSAFIMKVSLNCYTFSYDYNSGIQIES